jgi:hypothetical protein
MIANTPKASGGLSKHRWKFVVAALAFAAVILATRFGARTRGNRDKDALAMREGKAIYEKIREVTKTVETANDLLKKSVEASSSDAGREAKPDLGSIEQLVGLKRPFSANEFHRGLYRAFPDDAIDELFDYYNNINILWDGFNGLGAKTRRHPVGGSVFSHVPQQASGTWVIVSLPSGHGGDVIAGNPSEVRGDLLDLCTRMNKVLESQARVLKALETSAAMAP